MYPHLQEAVTHAGLDPVNFQMNLAANGIDALISFEPKVWFFAAPMHTIIDPRWTTYWIVAGWAKDPMPNELCEELVLNIKKLASSSNCRNVLYRDETPFLMNVLKAAGEPVWQQAKW